MQPDRKTDDIYMFSDVYEHISLGIEKKSFDKIN